MSCVHYEIEEATYVLIHAKMVANAAELPLMPPPPPLHKAFFFPNLPSITQGAHTRSLYQVEPQPHFYEIAFVIL